jgi:hypothetical protein
MSPNIYDSLTIPVIMAPFTTAIKGIALGLAPVLFVSQILAEQVQLLKGKKPEYVRVVINTILVYIVILFMYRWMFTKILGICEVTALMVSNASDWGDLLTQLAREESAKLSVVNLNITAFLSAFFSVIMKILEEVFITVRYVILALFYAIGPLAIAASITSQTRSFLTSWFAGLFQVCFWIIMFRLMQGILTTINIGSMVYGDGVPGPIVAGIIISVLTFLIPSLTTSILSTGNIGAVGSVAVGMIAAARSIPAVKAIGSTAAGIGKKGISALAQSIIKRFKSTPSDVKPSDKPGRRR